jgi:PAS domain S-box-containing protein
MEVTLSRKRANSRTRGRKLHLTEAKARVGRARKTRADLEQELKACRREIAHARKRLAEATMQQTATSGMLRLISNSPIQSVLDAVAENAARLCDASNARIWRLEGNHLRLVASYGESSATMDGREGLPADRDTVTGRAACDRRTIHVPDIAAEVNEYPVGSRIVKGEGWRTTLATPLLREGTPIGIILVRRMEVRPFSDKQIALLETFADQAVIAIENACLYNDLQERESRIRRLVDSNIIGIFIGDSRGRIIEANDAFLEMLGYGHDDVISGRMRWTKLTPTEWAPADEDALAQLSATGTCRPYKKEYYRKDGSRVSVLVGGAFFERKATEGVVFVVDMSDRKRAEEQLRASEERLVDVQMELAHATRVMTLGQLTASIAHEVKQPIAAARNNASAALNFLDKQPPDLGEVREALGCIVGDADRAGDIIDRIRDHIKKAPPGNDCFDLNMAINEVIELAKSAITQSGVSVQTRLAEGMNAVRGDRVQIQQVVLNLILNAIEAMGSVEAGARQLLISTEQSQTNDILIAVRDSGPGIDPECIERIFEAFYTTKSGGMGMGLSICRSIIDAHGGRLWAEANEPGGAIFQFTVPSAEKELMNCPQSARKTGEPHEDTPVDTSHQPASEGSKRLHPSKRGSGFDHRRRPSRGSSESGDLKR